MPIRLSVIWPLQHYNGKLTFLKGNDMQFTNLKQKVILSHIGGGTWKVVEKMSEICPEHNPRSVHALTLKIKYFIL